MVKSEKETRNRVWLKLCGYDVVALKPEFDEHAVELKSAISMGILAHRDLARADFYDVALEDGWAYIHVYRDKHAVYLVAYSSSTLNLTLRADEGRQKPYQKTARPELAAISATGE